MLKSRIIQLIILLTIISSSTGISRQSQEIKNILVVFAQQPNTPAYILFLDGIEQKFTEEFGESYNLYTEYLEKEGYGKGEYPKEKFNLINEKFNNSNLDLLICVGFNIIEIIQENASDYILNLPTVSVDLDLSSYGYTTDFAINKQSAQIRLKLNAERTIRTALDLFPQTATVYFFSGISDLDQLLLSVSKQVAKRILANKKVSFITGISMDETLKMVHNLPENSIIFVPGYNIDVNKVPYLNRESIRLISKSANAPVFVYTSTGFGEGTIGGYILNFEKSGLITGKSAVKILNGANPNSIKISESDYYEYLFDWRELKRWNLENSDLIPEGSTILFEENSPFDEYKWIGGGVLLFIILQTLLIATLIRLNRNQKLMTKKIIETENKYRDFLHEDRSLRLGQLTASLSHELNQPLTAILSTAQAGINFINSNEATPDLLKQILQKIVENDKRTASILSSVRGMLKLESREKEKVNLVSLINEVAAVVQSEAAELNIKLNVDIIHERVDILADKIQIQQVLLNLISNALQSLEKSNPSNKEITITDSIGNNEVTISVRDNGVGIEESIKDKLFKPFVSVKKDGTGIGLTICRSIIEDHQGKIWAENMPDGGAKFSFSLKILKDE